MRDFVQMDFWGWHYPTYNVADAALVVGIVILLLGPLRAPRETAAPPR
ncbi:MAG: signal peptidase II [Planctomycetota bacterium]